MEFEHLKNEIIEANTISNQMYSEMDVKRGLRNSDGSGVLAGLSRISSVIGVRQDNGSRQPTDGVLKYRGRMIHDLVRDTDGQSRFEYVVFLLLTGREPSKDEQHQLQQFLSHHRTLSREFTDHLMRALPSKNIMNKLDIHDVASLTRFMVNEGLVIPDQTLSSPMPNGSINLI